MRSIADSYYKIKQHIREVAQRCQRSSDEITLVVVSKTHQWEHVKPAYDAGCRDFGENTVQEAVKKMEGTPSDISWHMIGTLQKNKVRKAIENFALIHSVDNFSLAEKIAQCSQELGITAKILLQVNTSGEASKHGLTDAGWRKNFPSLLALPNIAIAGLMTMAPQTDDHDLIRSCFSKLRLFKEELNEHYPSLNLQHLSMGMSNDYPIAIEEGATILRIGSAIFGSRF